MKTILLISVVVCSVVAQRFGRPGPQGGEPGFGQQRPGQQGPGKPGFGFPGQHRPGPGPIGPGSEADRELFRKCVNETGISDDDLKALRNVTLNTTLTDDQSSLICCLSASKIVDNQLNITSLINRPIRPGSNESSIETIVSSCESDGITASTLDTCEKIAPFMLCIYTKLRPQGPGPNGPGHHRPGPNRPNRPGSSADRQLFKKCVNESAISQDELKALRDAAADATLSTDQSSFICCLAAPKIVDQQLNVTSLEIKPSKPGCDNSSVNVTTVVSSCESNGVTATTLDTCDNIAPFMHCVFTKLRGECTEADSE